MTTPTHVDQDVVPSPASSSLPALPGGSSSGRRTPMAVVVAGSLLTGSLVAVALAAAPLVPATETTLTGAVLCGFATGWAALAGLSARFTSQPQRWAAVPAVVLGASGLALLALGSSAHPIIDWVWPLVLFGLAVWMAVRIRRELASRTARWLLYPVIGAMSIAAIGGVYQTVGTAVDASTVSMPGRLIDVGGHRLHISCAGSGSPTVVVEGGGGATAADLGWISTGVARETTICVYDRAGRGWSEDAGAPQDADAISNDLDTLLHRADVPGPYVIAGHSFGGLYALTFATHHPDEVAGMVLIDSTSPHYGSAATAAARPAASETYDPIGRIAALTSSLARLGFGRLYATVAQVDLPARERAEVRASTAMPGTLRSTIEEYAQANASMEQAALLRDFGNKPLMVLTAGAGNANDWTQKQDRLAALSTDSVHRVVDDATHDALVGDPVHAATTTQAILDVVQAVRTGHTLSR
ncbi:alpha/beta fold hydrolase [Cellulomonas sp. McL0617]|uniref:alpha/beta fold hydrolase n=1 Tax=Cellulomonas sp. McL0617 TaxID=3415675 RepID=UPI003CF4964C